MYQETRAFIKKKKIQNHELNAKIKSESQIKQEKNPHNK